MKRQAHTKITIAKSLLVGQSTIESMRPDGAAPYQRVALRSGMIYFMEAEQAAALRWRHLTTPMWRPADGSRSIVGGATVWVATLGTEDVACIAWEWAKLENDVFAIANMLSIESNLYLEHTDVPVPRRKGRLLFLTRLIARLDWQEQVRRRCLEHVNCTDEALFGR